jgi:organic radical activating enzyme
MFGKNQVSGSFNESGTHLLVNEVFYTIQGEGPDAGRPAIFVRLSKCNLRCYFCDTEFETGQEIDLQRLADEVLQLSRLHGCRLVVITGGEPLLQNIVPLVRHMNKFGVSCSVETAGTVVLPDLHTVFDPMRSIHGNLIVCSPKTPKIHPKIERFVGAWKYVVKAGEGGPATGLPMGSTQHPGKVGSAFVPVHPVVPIYVQPMDEGLDGRNSDNLAHARDLSLKYGYRLGVQIHKLVGVR